MSLSNFLYHSIQYMLLPMMFAYTYLFRLTLARFLYKTSTSMSINTAITATSNIMIDAITPLINPIIVPVLVSVG